MTALTVLGVLILLGVVSIWSVMSQLLSEIKALHHTMREMRQTLVELDLRAETALSLMPIPKRDTKWLDDLASNAPDP
jgi:predicted PurR-regulated permease PerM